MVGIFRHTLLIYAFSDIAFLKRCCIKSQKTVKITVVENRGSWPFGKWKTCHSVARLQHFRLCMCIVMILLKVWSLSFCGHRISCTSSIREWIYIPIDFLWSWSKHGKSRYLLFPWSKFQCNRVHFVELYPARIKYIFCAWNGRYEILCLRNRLNSERLVHYIWLRKNPVDYEPALY